MSTIKTVRIPSEKLKTHRAKERPEVMLAMIYITYGQQEGVKQYVEWSFEMLSFEIFAHNVILT